MGCKFIGIKKPGFVTKTQFFLVFSVISLFSDSSREIFNMVVRQGTIESTATIESDSLPEEEINSPVKYVNIMQYGTYYTYSAWYIVHHTQYCTVKCVQSRLYK